MHFGVPGPRALATAAFDSAANTLSLGGYGEYQRLRARAARDAHDMNRSQVDTAIANNAGAFNNNQMTAMQTVRRLYTLAKVTQGVNANVSDDAMRGGHLVIEDDGHTNNYLTPKSNGTMDGGNRRPRGWFNLPSSHYPGNNATQHEVQLPSDNNMNFGTILHGSKNSAVAGVTSESWVQMEAHSGVWSTNGGWGRYQDDVALHSADYQRHRTTGQNVGPLGTSPMTEAAPLRLRAAHFKNAKHGTLAAMAARQRNARLNLPRDASGRST